jgi:hypothetical protein
VVKHQVYRPAWHEPARYEYTRQLIGILDQLLPAGMAGSISTLPIAWGQPPPPTAQSLQAAAHLRQTARDLAELEARSGRLVCLCLEPEPGCVLQRSEDVVRFFKDHLLPGADERVVRRYLRVCHDVCHQVVMFEEQAAVLDRYRAAGIGVGKIQVSAAVCAEFTANAEQRRAVLDQLSGFVEERYLHQTVCRSAASGRSTFHEDLPLALSAQPAPQSGDEWRTHFHVPIYLEEFGRLRASQSAIRECLREALAHGDCDHFEVETYAWGVLPTELQQPDLATGIARELRWVTDATAGQH